MTLSGLHLLLTYQCNLECDHCFVWGSPWQTGTMTGRSITRILAQAQDMGTIEWVYFEGGEPFLYYPVLVKGVQEAAGLGFRVGVVTNGYWATDVEDALEWLRPFVGLLQDLSVSSDLYHGGEQISEQVTNATAAAEALGIPLGIISIAQPEAAAATPAVGQLPPGDSAVMYRGRAAERLAGRVSHRHWTGFTACPHENLREPGRVHVDPWGNVHICQGICLGNLFRTSLRAICAAYRPEAHPITGPLVEGGPAELVRHYALPHEDACADACHLCYEARRALRTRFPKFLGPDQMYGP
ncbi:MAG: radical SAM protein [Armatimonadetes bacterium]|nr:radical SAM protein [Armatimonadota bacterium]